MSHGLTIAVILLVCAGIFFGSLEQARAVMRRQQKNPGGLLEAKKNTIRGDIAALTRDTARAARRRLSVNIKDTKTGTIEHNADKMPVVVIDLRAARIDARSIRGAVPECKRDITAVEKKLIAVVCRN